MNGSVDLIVQKQILAIHRMIHPRGSLLQNKKTRYYVERLAQRLYIVPNSTKKV